MNKSKFSEELYRELANCIRVLTIDAVEKANSGHPGMPLGMADVATVLFAEFLQFCPVAPKWINRDRFILSAGHGSMLLYSLLYLTGYEDITIEDLKNFRQLHSKTAGHPEYGTFAGVECSTGPLGQGIANAVGMAIAAKIHSLNHDVYVIAGDGCLMEGISHEACSLAGHLGLDNLILLYDDNGITIDGKKSLADSENALKRFEAYGWYTQAIDGHNFDQISDALANAKASNAPSVISCKTIIGFGAPTKAGCESSHGSPLGVEEAANTKAFHGWCIDKHFDIPDKLLNIWRNEIGKRCSADSAKVLEVQLPTNLDQIIEQIKNKFHNEQVTEATRKSSGKILSELCKHIPSIVPGSADLTESNYTSALSNRVPITKENFHGNYIHYGIREHAMSGIMNGLSLYGGIIPCGGTFLVFVDYMRAGVRLSALTERQVIYIMTHDSIGLGEDGPTHQPVEQLASLRAMPNLNVLRPADAIETAECWQIMLESKTTPSVLCLTRQNVPCVRTNTRDNLCKKGAYVLSDSQIFDNYQRHCERLHQQTRGNLNKQDEIAAAASRPRNDGIVERDKTGGKEIRHHKDAPPWRSSLYPSVTLFASGSEVSIALDAQQLLREQGISARVVSVPCMEIFEKQSEEYKADIIRNDTLNVAIEAGVKLGWERYIGPQGIFIGMKGFGMSGSGPDLYKYFRITSKNVVCSVLNILGR